MSTLHTHTIPIPLPENPEASGKLTRFLQAMEATGLCRVKQAVIVETENWNAYQVIDDLLNPPEPKPEPKVEKNGHAQNNQNPGNVYTDSETGETITAQAMGARLRFFKYPVGKRFTHLGPGFMEVAQDPDTERYYLRQVVALPTEA